MDASGADRSRRVRLALRDLLPAPAACLHRLGGRERLAVAVVAGAGRLRRGAALDPLPAERDRPAAHAARLAPYLWRRRRRRVRARRGRLTDLPPGGG